MKRLVLISLVAALGLASGAAFGLARAGDRHPITALQVKARPSPAAPSTQPAAPSDQAVEAPAVAPCDPEAMLPVIRESIDPRSDLGRFWDKVDIKECQNGYAHVFAITGGPPPPPGTQLEGSEQVFLQDIAGEWNMLSSGSGLDCYPGSVPEDLKDACAALGLP